MTPLFPRSLNNLYPDIGQPPSSSGAVQLKVRVVSVPPALIGSLGWLGVTHEYTVSASLSTDSPLKLTADTLY